MNDRLIYLCDLTHTAHGVVSEFVPYGVGCIKSYFHAHSRFGKDVEVKIFKYPADLAASFERERPGVVAFSNYVWNSNLGHSFARRIKELEPDCLTLAGGPNYPLEDSQQERFLREHPAYDFYIIGEGERPFTQVMDVWLAARDKKALVAAGLSGLHGLVDGKLAKCDDEVPRQDNLDDFPSPYLAGYLDEFLLLPNSIPLVESTRGCPFTCAYCERGSVKWTRLTRKSVEVFEQELKSIVGKTKSSLLLLADSNFGMYAQDVEISRIIKRSQDATGYPLYVSVSTGKNAEENILKCVEILGDSLPLTAAVQSLDPDVLKNVKRQNVSAEKLIGMAKLARKRDTITRSEVILGLPGDSRAKHFDTVFQLVDAGMDLILLYTLMLLDGSELNTTTYRQRYRMETRFRLSHRCYGSYPFGTAVIHAAELEEAVVGLDTMTYEDYLECRALALSSSIFYSDDILFELYEFLKGQGVRASAFMRGVHENRKRLMPANLAALYQHFEADTAQELWTDREALMELLRTGDEDEIRARAVGYNILFSYRAQAFFEFVDEIAHTAFQAARELLPEAALREHGAYLAELEQYIVLKKRNPFDHKQTYTASFHYDFPSLEESRFEAAPERLAEPVSLDFRHSERQSALLESFEPGIEGAKRAIPRLSIPKIYRMASRA